VVRGAVFLDGDGMTIEGFGWLLACGPIGLSGSYYCFHLPSDGCDCLKLATGPFGGVSGDSESELSIPAVVEDKISDVEAGVASGCQGVLVLGSPSEEGSGWSVAAGLGSASDLVLGAVS